MIRLLVLGLIHLFLFNPAYGTLLIPDQEIAAVLDATAQRPGYQKPMPNWVAKEFKEVVSQSVAAGKGANKWMDNIFHTQDSVVKANLNIIANASNNAKGAFGEIASDVFMTSKGYQPLHPRKAALTDGWGETGIDGLFKKNGTYFIVEAKYTGSATLKMTDDGLQMSDTWIFGSDRLKKAVGEDIADEIINLKNYKRVLAKIEPNGSIVYRELDSLGKEIGDFIP